MNTSSAKWYIQFKKFYQFYEALLTFAYVEGSELIGPLELKIIRNKKHKSSKSKSILNGNDNKPRRFLFGEITYNQKTIYIVEIEQDHSWGPSTWIFMLKKILHSTLKLI